LTEDKLATLLERSLAFQAAVQEHVGALVPASGARFEIAYQSNLLSLEHGFSALILIDQGLLSSSFSLLRPQYESLLRGVWLLYAATNEEVAKLTQPLTVLSAQQAANADFSVKKMLDKLDVCTDAPMPLILQLKEFKDVTGKALNDFTHGGLHALSRSATGYPIQLVYDVVRNSNAVVAIGAQLASILSGYTENMQPVRRMHEDFADCLPIIGSHESHEPA